LLADRIWMGRFTGLPYQANSLSQELYSEFDELRRERELEDARIDTWVTSLSATDLGSVLKFVSVLSPQPRQYPLWFAVTHFFNHQTHHRGQITTLLTQLGIDPGVTDLLLLPQYQPTK
jgi:uncharacterized damage-inducible protein DinB